MLRLQWLLRYRHLQWLKHVKRSNLFLVAFAASLIQLIVVLNCCMSQWVLGRRNYEQQVSVFAVWSQAILPGDAVLVAFIARAATMPCCVILRLRTLELLVMSMLSKHKQKCQIKMLQNPVISLLTRKLLHHIPLVSQVFQVQLTMFCRLAGLVHVFSAVSSS